MPVKRLPKNKSAEPSKKWFEIKNLAEAGTAEIRLRGLIGNAKQYRDYWSDEMVDDPEAAGTLNEFEAELLALGDVKNLQVSIFSQGGDWATGVAIHNLLIRHPANKVCVIDGLCASAATYAAMACDEIKIPSNASMLIHEASGCECGNAADLRAYADNLDSISNNIAELYAARTGKPVDELRNIMATDRYLSGKECVDLGLADTLIEPLANLAQRAGSLQPVNTASLRSAPAEVLALFDMRAVSNLRSITNRPTAMTEAELKAAQVKLAADQAAFEKTKNDAEALRIKNEADAKAKEAVVPTPAPAADMATLITNAVSTALDAKLKPLEDEVTRLKNLQVAGVALTGAPPVGNVLTPPDGAPVSKPKNKAELATAIQNAKTGDERLELLREFRKSQAA